MQAYTIRLSINKDLKLRKEKGGIATPLEVGFLIRSPSYLKVT